MPEQGKRSLLAPGQIDSIWRFLRTSKVVCLITSFSFCTIDLQYFAKYSLSKHNSNVSKKILPHEATKHGTLFPGSEARYQAYDFPGTRPRVRCWFLAGYKDWGKSELSLDCLTLSTWQTLLCSVSGKLKLEEGTADKVRAGKVKREESSKQNITYILWKWCLCFSSSSRHTEVMDGKMSWNVGERY